MNFIEYQKRRDFASARRQAQATLCTLAKVSIKKEFRENRTLTFVPGAPAVDMVVFGVSAGLVIVFCRKTSN